MTVPLPPLLYHGALDSADLTDVNFRGNGAAHKIPVAPGHPVQYTPFTVTFAFGVGEPIACSHVAFVEAVKRIYTQTLSWGAVGTPMKMASKGGEHSVGGGKAGYCLALARNPALFAL
jgi:hypothetical protein